MRRATECELPLHASLYALRLHPVAVQPGTLVLLVENPRLVEAAVERALPSCVVAGNGNPSAAVIELLTQLRKSGALILYHGDFDAAGIAICRRPFAQARRLPDSSRIKMFGVRIYQTGKLRLPRDSSLGGGRAVENGLPGRPRLPHVSQERCNPCTRIPLSFWNC